MASMNPKLVRNWWISIGCNGKAADVELGPKCKDGGFWLTIWQRSNGQVTKAASIQGVEKNGELTLLTEVSGHHPARHVTRR